MSTLTERLKKALAEPSTATALAKRLKVSKMSVFRVLRQVGKKTGTKREGRGGPKSAIWKLKLRPSSASDRKESK